MLKKLLIGATIAVAAAIAVPTAANAAGYVPSSLVSSPPSVAPGGTATVGFGAGSFSPNEAVSVSVSGATPVTLAAVGAQVTTTISKHADASGATSVKVTLPTNASGSYTLTATGATSGNVGTATLTAAGAATGTAGSSSAVGATGTTGGLAFTGGTVPMALVWGASGALGLGIALVLVMTVVRRQRERV